MSNRVNKNCILNPGDILYDRYQIVRKLGSGRFSKVWMVHDLVDEECYAIKVFKRGYDYKDYFDNEVLIYTELGNDCKYIQRFDHAFVHINYNGRNKSELAPVTDFYPCLRFELLGDNLFDLLNEVGGGMPFDTTQRLMREILIATDYMHKKNIIHTDLKPENILLTKKIANMNSNDEIEIRLADMGSSTTAEDLFTHTIGTQEYLSPEVLLRGDYTTKTDIWSIGCLLFELLTGDDLFDVFNSDDYEDTSGSRDTTDDTDTSYDSDNMDESDESDESTDSAGSTDYDSESDDSSEYSLSESEYNTIHKHLVKIQNLIGAYDQNIASKCEHYDKFFTSGKLNTNTKFTDVYVGGSTKRSITEILVSDYEFEQDVSKSIDSFIMACLKYDENDRPSTEKLLSMDFMIRKF